MAKKRCVHGRRIRKKKGKPERCICCGTKKRLSWTSCTHLLKCRGCRPKLTVFTLKPGAYS